MKRFLPGQLLRRLLLDIRLLGALIGDYWRGRYRRVPVWSLVVFLGAVLYLVSPFDLIPDYIPGYGQIDDALVALAGLYLLEKDLRAYRLWKERQSQ